MSTENAPDVFQNVQAIQPAPVSADLGNSMWKQIGQGIDAWVNGLIEEAGNLVGAVVTKGPGIVMDGVASVTNVVAGAASSVTSSVKNLVPSFSPSEPSVSASAVGQEQTLSRSRGDESPLGTLPPPPGLPAMPVQSINVGHGRY